MKQHSLHSFSIQSYSALPFWIRNNLEPIREQFRIETQSNRVHSNRIF